MTMLAREETSISTGAPTSIIFDSKAATQAMLQSMTYSHFACFLAGAALIGVLAFGFIAVQAWERADLLQLEVESFKNVLHANDLQTAAHLEGESP